MHIVHTFGHLVGGTLLVAGTSIGVGMLALPVATASRRIYPFSSPLPHLLDFHALHRSSDPGGLHLDAKGR